jgi:hypothetical protein
MANGGFLTPILPTGQSLETGGYWSRKCSYVDRLSRSKKLTARFPFPIRIDRIKGIMHDHFSRYGDLRCIIHLDQVNNAAVKAIVVFSVSGFLVKVKRFITDL